jgi:Zn-dependent protease/CBS domain-containing protein
MKWSWRIFRVAGIGIHVHLTFPLLLIWGGVTQYMGRGSWNDAWIGVGFILVLFVIVVLHELGHAMAARRYGIRTLDITLLPIGGLARLERMPEEPKQELVVALAGPAVNVALALLLFAVVSGGWQLAHWLDVPPAGFKFLVNLMWINIVLAVFNLLPAFPMDGGRVLRALLATRMSYVRATNIAARVGQAMAVLFGIVGWFVVHNPMLVLVAFFVFMGAAQEAMMVRTRSALGTIPAGQLMIKNFRALSPQDPLSLAAEHLLAGWQHDFPVTDQGQLVGVLTRTDLVEGLSQYGRNAPVDRVMHRQFPSGKPDEPAQAALMRLREGNWQTMPIIADAQLLGILTRENIGEYLMVQSALQRESQYPGLNHAINQEQLIADSP